MSGLNVIYKSSQTVFTFNDICLLWRETNKKSVISKINYYIKTKQLTRIRKGIYGKDDEYNKMELASKIYIPAYISFETILAQEGINFQFYNEIKIASYLNRRIEIDNQIYSFFKIKNEILVNPLGISNTDGINKATKERALLDTLYINGNYYFDNVGAINWDFVYEILPIYNNKRMNKNIKELYAKYRKT